MNNVFEPEDSTDCSDIYYRLYAKGMENSLVTYWSNPPQLDEKSKKNLNLITDLLSDSMSESKYVPIIILIDEKGIPYCNSVLKFNDKYPVTDDVRAAIFYIVDSLRFLPAYRGKVPVKSFYFLTARKYKQTNRWFFPESRMN
ncbi:hypothetical protein NXY11_15005 [Parabacteroides faecis]|uniref:hypothetical protein n=1 Tax=Parabacteroides faecis TaxID=1217282 RepID=UPI00216403AB|nr:hypothetical protein [Parabacteroides faecis]MCS2891887.1 hypothetical protein [Parabacteroides faecis]UVQ44508.1 hypothetical protein NXY11_15005 [Parabacteroides faecis]